MTLILILNNVIILDLIFQTSSDDFPDVIDQSQIEIGAEIEQETSQNNNPIVENVGEDTNADVERCTSCNSGTMAQNCCFYHVSCTPLPTLKPHKNYQVNKVESITSSLKRQFYKS